VVEGHEAPPIVNNGVMFVATPEAQILALDVRTGNLLWRYKQVNLGRSVTASNANPPETSRV
jgi:glucose dehydrogenase